MYVFFVQAIGVIALICGLLSFQQKKRKQILVFQMLAHILFVFQFLLLGAYTGACLDFIAFIRTLIFSNNQKKWASSSLWVVLFLVIMLVAGILTWDNVYSIFAIIASCLATVAMWVKSERYIRLISLFVGPCWFVYCLVNGSYSGAFNELLGIASIIIGMVRLDRNKK